MKMYAGTIPREVLNLNTREAYYGRQKQLFVLVFIIVSVVPLVMINWHSSSYYQESWLEKTSLELAGIAKDRKELIDLFLETQVNQLSGFAKQFDGDYLSRQQNLAELFKNFNATGVITDLGFIDRTGRHLAYVGPFSRELADKNYLDSQWFQEVMENGIFISDVFSGYRQVPHFIIAVTDTQKSWVLRATINSEIFNALVASANVGPGGDAFIISEGGELQTPSRMERNTLSKGEAEMIFRLAAIGGHTQRVGGLLYSVLPVKDGKWHLVLETNVDSSLAEFYKARNLGIFIIVIAALVILVVSLLVIRSMVDKISRADRQRMVLADNVRQVEKMALIGRLAASVAHEINNPLQVITDQAGWMDELLDDEPPDKVANLKEYRESLSKIRRHVKRAGTITHRLLGFSRFRDGEWVATAIEATVEETILLLENDARNHRIAITRHYGEGLPAVKTDSAQLQQVFLNILNNAMDAIGQEGRIEVTTRMDGQQVAVDFADSGPGMPPDAMEKVFDPFYTTKQKGKGTGLGLSISSNIMKRLGGGIRVTIGAQGGCVFTVFLPADASGPETADWKKAV